MEDFQSGFNTLPKNLQTEKEIEIEKNIVVEPPANAVQKPAEKYPVGDFEFQCGEMLIRSCIAVFPNSKVPKTEEEKRKWAMDIERMKRLDVRSEADIIEALTFATTDGFWKSNIRSAKKLRENFEILIVQSRAKAGKSGMVQKPRSMTTDSTQRQLGGGIVDARRI